MRLWWTKSSLQGDESAGNRSGKIADLVVDVDTGRILYAILNLGVSIGESASRRGLPGRAAPRRHLLPQNQTKA
jgi:hypothetical protein